MAMLVSYWERRDASDRDQFGRAALAYCRAARACDGVRGARFYWLNPDLLVVAVDVESLEVGDISLLTPDTARTMFALSDLGRPVRTERWGDPARGEEAYRLSRQ